MPTRKKVEKEEEMTEGQYNQAVAQVLQAYFTTDINNKISAMTDDEMWNLLRDLERQEHWIALLKYVNKRLMIAQQVVNTLDPVQNPTSIARTQGIMTGIVDPQNTIISLVESEKASREEAQRITDVVS